LDVIQNTDGYLSMGASVPIYWWCNWVMTNFGGVLFKNGNLILKIICE